MRKTITLLASEAKRVTAKRLITFLLIFLVLSIIVLQSGIWKHRNENKQEEEFKALQKKSMSQISDIKTLTLRGLDIISISSPVTAIFSNSAPFKFLQSYINDAEKLKIDSSNLGKLTFESSSNKNIDISWMIMIIGSLLVMAWGFDSFRNTEYIKFLLSFARPIQVFLGIILARVFILILYLAFLTAVIIGQFLLNGIGLNGKDILAILTFGLISLLVSVLFLIAGAIIGSIKNTSKAIITAFICWFCLVFLFPNIINEVCSRDSISNSKSLYSHEIDKLGIIMEHYSQVEKDLLQIKSIPEKIEAVKKWNEIAWNSTIKKIEKLETEMMTGIKDQAERLYLMNVFTPVSFYSSVNNEISSRGYNFLISFYKYVQGKQKGFVRYYFDHIFDDYSKIEPFMKKEDYVFQARPSLPRYFGLGLVINLFYLLLALVLGYFAFLRAVFPKSAKNENFDEIEIQMENGKFHSYKHDTSGFKEQLYNVLKGHAETFAGEVSIDGKRISPGDELDFVYLPGQKSIPQDVKGGSYLKLVFRLLNFSGDASKKAIEKVGNLIDKNFGDMKPLEKLNFLLLLADLSKKRFLVIDRPFSYSFKDDVPPLCRELKARYDLIVELLPEEFNLQHHECEKKSYFFLVDEEYSQRVSE